MKVRTKLIIGYSVVTVLLWLIVSYAANNLGDLKGHFTVVEREIIPNTIEIAEIEKAADEAYQLTMDYALYDLPEAKTSSRIKIHDLEKLSQQYLPVAELISPGEYTDNTMLLAKIDSLALNLTYILNLKDQGTSHNDLLALDRSTSLPALLDLEQFINEKRADSIAQLSVIGEGFNNAHFEGLHSLFVSAGWITII